MVKWEITKQPMEKATTWKGFSKLQVPPSISTILCKPSLIIHSVPQKINVSEPSFPRKPHFQYFAINILTKIIFKAIAISHPYKAIRKSGLNFIRYITCDTKCPFWKNVRHASTTLHITATPKTAFPAALRRNTSKSFIYLYNRLPSAK